MKLTEFISQNEERIIKEWVAFAGTLLPWAAGMSDKGKRDHAQDLLKAVVEDMQRPQSGAEQAEKSQGKAVEGQLAVVGQKHATDRVGSGFDLDQLVSEYRALRASILRLWAEETGERQVEVTRFNEAIDESLTEATVRYSQLLGHTKDQFLAILGHDLRNPLSTIMVGAVGLMDAEPAPGAHARIGARILRSAERMNRMVNDLLDFTRARLGHGIPVTRRHMDLALVCTQLTADLETQHPGGRLQCSTNGDLEGSWDGDRLTQALSNLVENALHYGDDRPVTIVAEGRADDVVVHVHNGGTEIPPASLKKIFEPMVRHAAGTRDRNPTGMGLGLYIAREIVSAHEGTLEVTSTAQAGTTFTVTLPRRPAAAKMHRS